MTRRGWIVLATVGAVLAAGLFVGYRTVFGGRDCEVTIGGTTVDVDRDEAERAATATAAASPRSIAAATSRVERVTELSGENARLVATALTGRRAAALTCRGGGSDAEEADSLDGDGLTGRAARVLEDLRERYGSPSVGGFAPGGVSTGHMPGSAHYDGRAIDVFFRPVNRPNKRAGWAMAQYLVAHAERLAIDTVIFDGRIWTARRSFQGWRDYEVSKRNRSAETIRILEHRDHVHVDVAD